MDPQVLLDIMPSMTKGFPVGVNWDKFRKHYDGLSFEDRTILSCYWDQMYPDQRHFHLTRFVEMFELVPENSRILELGCHTGCLAMQILNRFPKLVRWTGYDFRYPIDRTIVEDERYNTVVLKDWFYNTELIECDVFVSSHTLEHVSNKEAMAILNHVAGIKYIMLEVPVPENGRKWAGWGCSHVLTLGQRHIRDFLSNAGYRQIYNRPQIGGTLWTMQEDNTI